MLAAAGMLALAPAGPAHAVATTSPMAQVKAVTDQAVAVLKAPGLSVQQRRRKLRDLAQAHMDFPAMARSSLGYHWDKLSSAQQQEFSDLFSSFIENAYLNKIQGYIDLTFNFGRQIMTGANYAEVDSLVLQPHADPISLNFKLQRQTGVWKVYDVDIDSVSMVDNYRNQFNRVIDHQGFDTLMADLRRKDRELAQLLGTPQVPSH